MNETALSRETLNEIMRRVVAVADPERIVLFGSPARGKMNDNSNVGLLILQEGGDARLTARI